MRTVDSNDLLHEHEEAEEWDHNKLKQAIQTLFHEDLSNANYRRLSAKEARELIDKEFTKSGVYELNQYRSTAKRLVRKLNTCRDSTEVVLKLGEYLLK
jgi:hypothetical protein